MRSSPPELQASLRLLEAATGRYNELSERGEATSRSGWGAASSIFEEVPARRRLRGPGGGVDPGGVGYVRRPARSVSVPPLVGIELPKKAAPAKKAAPPKAAPG